MAKGGVFTESHHADLQQDIPQRSRGRMACKVSGQREKAVGKQSENMAELCGIKLGCFFLAAFAFL